MQTSIYVDGFNLYYRSLKGTPYKWLDLQTMCRLILPARNTITSIKYFTARVKDRPTNIGQAQRQQVYLRALGTLPIVSIIYGSFLTTTVRMLLAHPPARGARMVDVIKSEEKGSDVNIASHLLHDAHQGRFEVAVLVTNDSDLAEPIRLVTQELGLPVGVLYPGKQQSRVLCRYASFVRPIRTGVLAASQFSPDLTDQHGVFQKPATW